MYCCDELMIYDVERGVNVTRLIRKCLKCGKVKKEVEE